MHSRISNRINRRMNVTSHVSNRTAGCLLSVATVLGLSLALADQAQAQHATQRPITDFTKAQLAAIGFSTSSTCVPP